MKSTQSKTEIAFITSYPEKHATHHEKTVGVASYAKNLAVSLESTFAITVFGEYEQSKTSYEEGSIRVRRTWQRNNPASWIKTFLMVAHSHAQIVLISFEINMPGGLCSKLGYLAGMTMLRLLRKRIVLITHQAVISPKKVFGNITGTLAAPFVAFLYAYLLFVSEIVIVFEEEFKKAFGENQKVHTIPHAVEDIPANLSTIEAKKRVHFAQDRPVVLCFGYISPYKGIYELLQHYTQNDLYQLVIAGDANPNHKDNPAYMSYVERTKYLAAKKHIPYLGFIPEADIPSVFMAADIVIIPYLTFFSSSGPLSLAFTFGKPVLLSRKLEKYFQSEDFASSLASSRIPKESLLFNPDYSDLEQKISGISKNYNAHVSFSQAMKTARSWVNVSGKFCKLLLKNNEAVCK